MITIVIVWVLDVKNVAYKLSAPSVKVRAPQEYSDSIKPSEIFHMNIFIAKIFDWNIKKI